MAARIRVRLAEDQLQRVARTSAGRVTARVTRQVFNRARVLSPWDTGNLRASHTVDLRVLRNKRVRGRVTTRANYAAAVHEGTPPHVIRPKRRKALKFTYRGRVVIVKKVNHPGTRGRPWLRTALLEVAPRHGFRVSATR